jgi:ketosteroid isomerase-like protein
LWLVVPSLQAQEDALAQQYLDRLVALWEEESSSIDVEALGKLLSEDATYEHPRAGITMEGRTTILDAMSGFLGTSRSPEVSGVEMLSGPNVVVVGFDLSMEVRGSEGWLHIDRRQIIVLEISNGLITRFSDYW